MIDCADITRCAITEVISVVSELHSIDLEFLSTIIEFREIRELLSKLKNFFIFILTQP